MSTIAMSLGFTPNIQKWIFASEGGYVDHPKDPGGATNMGITRKTLAAWRGISPFTALPKSEVKNLTKAEAALIYEKNYWNAVRGSKLPLGVDYAVFDYAVNSGVSRAAKDLQRAVSRFYKGSIDGQLGTQTLQAVVDYCRAYGSADLINALCDLRWKFVERLGTFAVFGDGWKRRIWGNTMGVQVGDIGVADRAVMLANQKPVSQIPAPSEPTPGQAMPEKPSVIDTIKDPGVLGGIAAALGTVVTAIADQPVLQVALVAGIAFLIYRFVIVKREADPA